MRDYSKVSFVWKLEYSMMVYVRFIPFVFRKLANWHYLSFSSNGALRKLRLAVFKCPYYISHASFAFHVINKMKKN